MTDRRSTLNFAMFGFLCLFWGSTWISIKIGVTTVPPLFFASTRFLAAGCVLVLITFLTRELRPSHFRLLGVGLVPTLLMISVNYGLMAWGMTRVPSGVSAVVNLSVVPLSATSFSIIRGQTSRTWGRLAAIGLGSLGLCILFLPQSQLSLNQSSVLGILAIAVGAACYGSGSVILRSKNLDCPPRVLSAIQSVSGGFVLLMVSLLLEPIDRRTLSEFFSPTAFWSWAFLVVFGSILAFTIYLALLARWGAARVTAYAFVCPIIALVEGVIFTKENISWIEIIATVILLTATWLSLKPETTPVGRKRLVFKKGENDDLR